MSPQQPVLLVLGAAEHGVARYATEVADWVGEPVVRDPAVVPPGARVHLHVTDRLVDGDAAALLAVLGCLARRRARLTLTLHDVPQPTDGPAFARRVEVYRRLLAAAEGWATNSEHERAAVLRWCAPADGAGAVVPLPVVPGSGTGCATATDDAGWPCSVGVFGFVYPGKGHRPALAAAAHLRRRGRPVRFVVLGGPAPGHDADLAALVDLGARLGVPVEVTGRLPEAEVGPALRAVAVPVLGHRNVSASGSLGSWLTAGRRPLARSGAYTSEMARLRPGTTTSFADGHLVAALDAALADPASTWLAPGADLRPGPAETAEAYRAWWRALDRAVPA